MSAGDAPAVEATGIGRRFGRRRALAGVDVALAPGRTLALFGGNGAGKSTLVRIVAQVLRPSVGRVRIFGDDAARAREQVRSRIGFVGHELGLYLDLTPVENLAFAGRLYAVDGIRERIDEVLAAVGLSDRREQPVRMLSRGLQQRAALARALVHRPRLLLLDEPWTGLDRPAGEMLVGLLDTHRRDGGTTVLTTHDLKTGYRVADDVALLSVGRMALAGARADIPLAELERHFHKVAGGAA